MAFLRNSIIFIFLVIASELNSQDLSSPKLSQLLSTDLNTRLKINNSNPFHTCLLFQNEEKINTVLNKYKIKILSHHSSTNCKCVQITSNQQLSSLISDSNVLYLDKFYESGNEEILIPGHNLSVGNIHYVHQIYPQLNGNNIVVSIKENLLDTQDVDIKNRIISNPNSSTLFSPHASIMATWIAGAGNASSSGRGIAKASNVISTSFNNLFPEENTLYNTNQITIQNHSYGSDIDNSYGIYSMAYDQSVIENPNLVHVFSSGNSGTQVSPNGPYSGIKAYSNITGNSKMAKNTITVGALGINDSVQEFSSRGPAYDGRIKPDLVAYGHDGTSSSAAIVSGASAIIQQAWKDKTSILPSSDLVKAILTCSADDMNSHGPDFISGFGKLNLKSAIDLINNQKIILDQINSHKIKEFQIQIPSNIKLAKFVLTWIDPVAKIQASKALINDLDLVIVAPDGQEFFPWIPDNHPDFLTNVAIRGIDTINNIEIISIHNPVQGNYKIIIKSRFLQNDLQKFSFVSFLERENNFQWTFPLKTSLIESNKVITIHWSTNIEANAILEWKPAGVSDWRMITQLNNIKMENIKWQLPDTFCVAQLRMVIHGNYYLSDSFLISAIPKMKVNFSCKDSTFLYWNRIHPDALFKLYGLGDFYLENIFSTDDTSVILDRMKYPNKRFAISVTSKTYGLENSTDLAPNPDDVSTCYLQQFNASRIDISRTALLKLDLSSTYGIKRIFFEKLNSNQWTRLCEISLPQTSNTFYDSNTHQGSNSYRAIIEFNNDQKIITQASIVWFPQLNGFLFSPNLVYGSGTITIINDNVLNEVSYFKIYNLQGQELLNEELIENYSTLELPSFPYGIYLINIFSSSGIILFSDRLIIGH